MVARNMQAVYGEMEACCGQMLLNANAQDWDAFLHDAERFVAISSTLGNVDWQGMQEAERNALAEVMRTAQARIDAITPLAIERRQALLGSMRGLQNGEKMRRMYGG